MLWRICVCLGLGGASLALAACRARDDAPKPVIVSFPKANFSDGSAGVPRQVGLVGLVNENGHFVLVHADRWYTPSEGTALKCLRNGVETGVLSVGKERRGAFVSADIVTGKPQKGDEVFQ